MCYKVVMPKIVDHNARRAELAAAVWRVVERGGMSSASVRAVAAEAGVSPGSLRHYFSDQAELLVFAAEMMTARVVERLNAHLVDEGAGRHVGQRVLEELLPLDAERRIEATVWLECLSRARFDARLSELTTAGWAGERQVCRIAWASIRGLDRPQHPDESFTDQGDEQAAERLHTFIDGLTLQAVTFPEHLPPDRARRLLTDFLTSMSP